MELAGQVEAFRKRGLAVAAIVRDPLAKDPVKRLKEFATRHGIGYPLLADTAGVTERFGLTDVGFPPGDYYGVPYPGTFIVDAAGVVKERFFEERVDYRRSAGSILASAGAPGHGGQELRAPHFRLRVSLSNPEVVPGERLTLVLDFEMEPKRHAYAPGAKGYRPLAVRLEPDPALEIHETRFPEAHPYFFAPLKETTPVFEGSFRLLQDVTVKVHELLPRLQEAAEVRLTLRGALDYQVCSDTTCYPPGSLALQLPLTVRRWVQ